MALATVTPPTLAPHLVRATRPYARESGWRTWWSVWTTLIALVGMLALAVLAPWWPARAAAAVIGALMMVRGFILFHDHQHRAILRGSRLGAMLLVPLGWLLLVPARSWKRSHDHHHAHVGQLAESHVGAFPIWTVSQWRTAGLWRRWHYRFARSVLNIALAYVTVFFFSVTLEPFLRAPRRHWDSLVAIGVHAGVLVAAWWLGGFWAAFFALILPFSIASAIGAYLFYAQHNFPGVRCLPPEAWAFHRAALQSCSYIRMGRVMRWFTGDIGVHHVHHLNAGIPFYRLAEAMAAIPECQTPTVTSLRPRDVLACLRLKLWDPVAERMVGWREARSAAA